MSEEYLRCKYCDSSYRLIDIDIKCKYETKEVRHLMVDYTCPVCDYDTSSYIFKDDQE